MNLQHSAFHQSNVTDSFESIGASQALVATTSSAMSTRTVTEDSIQHRETHIIKMVTQNQARLRRQPQGPGSLVILSLAAPATVWIGSEFRAKHLLTYEFHDYLSC